MVFHFMVFTMLSWAVIGEGRTCHNTTIRYGSTVQVALHCSAVEDTTDAQSLSPFLHAQ